MKILNEHILEVRYKPNPKILDYRGTWSAGISKHMDFEHWGIVENRIDAYNEGNSLHAFVGFKHAGFVAVDTEMRDFFANKAVKFFKYLFSLEGFGKQLHVERLGVRSRFGQEYEGTFEELVDKFVANYLSLTEKATKIIDANLVDVGAPLNFKDKHGNFNTMCGPMKSDQLENYLSKRDSLPELSLYFDIDYWIRPKKLLDEREVIKNIKMFSEMAWNRFESISELIIKDKS